MALDSERGIYPSASDFPRIFSCPGSLNVKRALLNATKRKETGGKDADEGELLHEITMGRAPREGLSDEQEDAIDLAHYYREEALALAGIEGPHEVRMEKRLWVKDSAEKILYSGRFDELHLETPVVGQEAVKTALLVDFKFGRYEVTPAEANTQIMAYAVAAWKTWGFSTIYGAVIQPRVHREDRLSVARYTPKALPGAYKRITKQLKACEAPDAPRIPSTEACRYCPASHFCPESRAFFTSIPKK